MYLVCDLPAMSRPGKGRPHRVRALAITLGLVALLSTVTATLAEARGGRSTAADCANGSDDPDCPDTDAKKK